MDSLPQVAAALQHVLTAVPAAAARASGFCRRRSKLTAAVFVQALVLGWLARPEATLGELAQTAAKLGVSVSPQGLDQRFGPEAAELLETVLAAAVATLVAAQPVAIPLLERFAGVYLLDSTTIGLPDALAEVWAGCGGRTGHGAQAAVKLQVRFDLRGGTLEGPLRQAGREQDKRSPFQAAPVPTGGLRLSDLGFWSLAVFRGIGEGGAFWLSRLHLQVNVYAADGARLDLVPWLARQGAASVEAPVRLGASERLPARLLAARVPQAVADERRRKRKAAAKREGKTPSQRALALAGWTLLVTNVPAARLSLAEAFALARARWQVELLFKLWKSHGRIDASRSAQPWRILCEVYAKLTAMVIQHWVLLTGCWRFADRSLTQAAQTVREETACLVSALRARSRERLVEALGDIRRCLAAGCQLTKRRRKPSTFQLLLDPALGGLA
jgi:Transposase DDE domain